METTFVDDLGADSLDIFQIIMGIEEEFDIEIPNRGSRADCDSGRRGRANQECVKLMLDTRRAASGNPVSEGDFSRTLYHFSREAALGTGLLPAYHEQSGGSI